ncbi:MAG: DoxX family protein [Bacteroidetes bacterium]|nr:DoxX family protein [Bacteroidota bacterium]
MKKNSIIYWSVTGLFSVMMLFSAYNYFTNPQMAGAFTHLGFPPYFRIELAIAKIAGAIVLLLPQVPARLKEWTYAGFSITLVSAAVAHFSSGDPASVAIMPVIFFAVLMVSYWLLHKRQQASAASNAKPSFA